MSSSSYNLRCLFCCCYACHDLVHYCSTEIYKLFHPSERLLHQSAKAAGDADYPAYGVTGPSTKSSTVTNGDRKLAQSAQMYHYQHQKQQMIAMENRANGEMKQDNSDDDSEEENEEGDYTVYECPGLAPAGEMTVKNPLFNDDHDPSSPPPTKDGDN
uniref:Neural proliferation differentiation and control protein 1-like isoform X2 n=1 Tax=Saccoglossus kowalevskii TaxID=10224 RepID=A0ABM0MY89_SACKO|nr:PREDICTED: neural proliferation differentiation and control protein 1-like isoform X2 [Saccoglossus kowalevskii]